MFLCASLSTLVCETQAEQTNIEEFPPLDQGDLAIAAWMMTAINMPTISDSQVWTESFFSVVGTIHTNGFVVTDDGDTGMESTWFLVHTNEQIWAFGKLFERSSFDEARTALALELVSINMAPRLIADLYQVRTNNIGDFSIVRPKKNTEGELIDDFSCIYFIRGAKAVSLRGIPFDDNVNLRPVAEVLDALLKNPTASQ